MFAHVKNFFGLLKTAAVEWWEDNTFRLAASLAFYTIFSLAPVLVITIAIARFWFDDERATDQVVGQITTLVGEEGGLAVRAVATASQKTASGAFGVIVGIGSLLVGSTVVFMELQAALNLIWDVKADPSRGFWYSLVRDRLLSFALVLGVGFLLLVSLVLSATLAGVAAYFGGKGSQETILWQVINNVTSFVVAWLLFAMIFKVLPDAKITWRDVAIGSAVTAFLFSVGKHLIGLYLGKTATASTYGAAGSFAVLLIWIYYSALISFYGAEFTQVYARRYGSRIKPEEYAERVGEKPDAV